MGTSVRPPQSPKAPVTSPYCPTCYGASVVAIGPLPDSVWFAGASLKNALPGGVLYACRNCGLKFRFPVQEAPVYDRMYNNDLTQNWAAEGDRPDWDLIMAALRRLRPDAERILDFGCYAGGLLARIGGPAKLFGVEVNRKASIVAREASGASIWNSLDEIPPGIRFDAIVAADVVEHVRNPKELIEQLLSLLSRRGILIITTGDGEAPLWRRFGANWWYCYYAEHIAFISRRWLEFLTTTSCVSMLEFKTFSYRRLSVARRVVDTVATYAYGFFPRTFLGVKRRVQRLRGRNGLPSVPGNGISEDHLLAVLSPGSKL